MADRIRINYGQLDQLVDQLRRLSSAMSDAESAIRALRVPREGGAELEVKLSGAPLRSVPYSLRSGDVNQCLRSLAGGLDRLEQRVNRAAAATQHTRERFERTERSIAQLAMAQQIPVDWRSELCGQMGVPAEISSWTDADRERFNELIDSGKLAFEEGTVTLNTGSAVLMTLGNRLLTYERKSSFSNLQETWKWTDKQGSKHETERKIGLLDVFHYKPDDLKTKRKDIKPPRIIADEGYDKKKIDGKMSLVRVGGSVDSSVSALSGSFEIECNDKSKLSGSVNVLNANANASWEAGMYSYRVTEDGKTERVLSPGFSAKAGVSISLLESEISGEYELFDNVTAYSSLNATAGKVSLDGSVDLGYIDGELVAEVDGSFEAIAGEVGASVGVDLFGVRGDVTGKLNVGFGAHFKVGYRDGKICADIGASVGVGASVAFTLDVSKAVDKVADFGKDVYKGAKDFVSNIGKGFMGRSKCVLWQ